MWIQINQELPPEKMVVRTKVDDEHGVRNEQQLVRKNKLWFTTDMKMYVYYTPTHWWKL